MRRFSALFIAVATFAATPSFAATPTALVPLENQLKSIVAADPRNIGVAALDLSTGQLVSVNGEMPFPMASTVKVAIAANYMSQVEAGRRSLNDMIGGQSARSLMAAMLIHSDNRATDKILANLGGPAYVQNWLNQHGLQGLRIDRNIAGLLAAKRDLWDVRDSSTPNAMVQLLQKLDNGGLVRPESRSYILGLMAQCATGRNRIPGQLQGVKIEHKTGTLNGLSTDVGFITLPDNRRVALAVFSRSPTNRPSTIATAARAIYDGFITYVINPWRTVPVSASAFGASK
nr:serine hydrolase [uncultured Sphingomonas sp.]